jgi:hypothetical protein
MPANSKKKVVVIGVLDIRHKVCAIEKAHRNAERGHGEIEGVRYSKRAELGAVDLARTGDSGNVPQYYMCQLCAISLILN